MQTVINSKLYSTRHMILLYCNEWTIGVRNLQKEYEFIFYAENAMEYVFVRAYEDIENCYILREMKIAEKIEDVIKKINHKTKDEIFDFINSHADHKHLVVVNAATMLSADEMLKNFNISLA